jgi:hypothetical protein
MKAALPLAALAAMSALARPAHARPADGECEDVWYYQPPVYVGVNPGDAILFPRPSQCPATDGVCSLFAAVGLSYTHVALAYDSSGALLAQSQWDMVPPPSTQSTGGSHSCSRLLDSARLQSLNPGTTGTGGWDGAHTVGSALIVRNLGTPYCNSPADHYHFNSFIHDDVQGGSCEKYVVDYCGVPVEPEDKVWISGSQLNDGLTAVYFYAYEGALGITSSLPWYDYLVCGGVDSTIMAQRAAMQVINEIRWKWWELRMPNGDSTDTLGIDTNAEGVNVTAPWGWGTWEDLGGASQNTQWTGDPWNPNANTTYGWYCTDVNTSYQTPNGQLQGAGAECPSWRNYENSLPMNAPDNVANAANRLGSQWSGAQVTDGYYYYGGQVCY